MPSPTPKKDSSMATEHSVWTREQVLEMAFIITGTL